MNKHNDNLLRGSGKLQLKRQSFQEFAVLSLSFGNRFRLETEAAKRKDERSPREVTPKAWSRLSTDDTNVLLNQGEKARGETGFYSGY